MKAISHILVLILCLSIIACNQIDKNSQLLTNTSIKDTLPQTTQSVSLINLIATPQIYNKHKVKLVGYMHLQFESNAIYLHKEDFDQSINENSIWVQIPKDSVVLVKKMMSYDNKYVEIEGVFDSMDHEYKSDRSGALKAVTNCEIH